MKKALVALVVLTVGAAASAQSTVTLFGVVDATISSYSNRSEDSNPLARRSVKVSQTELRNSGYNTSRLGFRGTEDLGGGLAASFWLEAALINDNGGAGGTAVTSGTATASNLFNRRSTVSLSSGLGELRLGRDYTPSFWNDTVFDPFGSNGVGASVVYTANTVSIAGAAGGFGGNVNYVRASNTIGYFLPPSLGGVYGQLMYAFKEQTTYDPRTATPNVPNNSRAGRYAGGRVGYASGPVDVAISYADSTTADAFYAGTTDSVKTVNMGASYDFGPVKLMGELSRARNERDYEVPPVVAASNIDLLGYLVGVTVPIGPGLVRAAYSRVKYDNRSSSAVPDPKASKLALGYVHNLSKRTALYASAARLSNENRAALTVGGPAFVSSATLIPKRSTGYDFGIRHAF